ncbi:hypothetical protein GLOTRDRAFT_112738 [Gloeophyllum trabeum ATCC 11539]|uniref:Pyridoxamine 5'-phosphate oxidase Alr4036 family FMN-binding domain-containing protein n=1 Tax=Gloeophyllum trabeum (strain ATCC 11539 / FP-39264 / Madison 617) TaxID=670483 RepID=S7R7B2_GLOTA|nr:uncharacterized protein GLOTRDRAFT_112738 [Gloeophyllum trabeum ATCC 11539]EPQ50275.1 hypothetical protein GLOTRDRAFT_112738 [Gloeophyllum trabeum ATCC 11539]
MTSSPYSTASLKSAYGRNRWNGLQLATIDPVANMPEIRTLACIDLLEVKGQSAPLLVLSTDVRTPKVSQILANPRVQVLWWFGDTHEQFRISGVASIVAAPGTPTYDSLKDKINLPGDVDLETKRVEVFNAMPNYMSHYLRPTWGTPLRKAPHSETWPKVTLPTENSSDEDKLHYEEALKNFSLIVIEPVVVDYRSQQERVVSKKLDNGLWENEPVVMP